MSVLSKIASAQNRNDEAPNIALAKELAAAEDTEAIADLVENLANIDKNIQSDCIKVLYEIGAIKPRLIADFVDDFIKLLESHNNRLVWGAMTALGAIAPFRVDDIWASIDRVIHATESGSVITQDWGIRILAIVSAANPAYEERLFPYLKSFLHESPSKDLPRHAESVLVTVNERNSDDFLKLLQERLPALKPASAKRIEKLMRQIHKL